MDKELKELMIEINKELQEIKILLKSQKEQKRKQIAEVSKVNYNGLVINPVKQLHRSKKPNIYRIDYFINNFINRGKK